MRTVQRIVFRHGRGRVNTSADPRATLHTIEGDTVLIDRAGLTRVGHLAVRAVTRAAAAPAQRRAAVLGERQRVAAA